MNKKRILSLAFGTLMAATASAVPAKPGLWRTITIADGTELRVQLCGDERGAFWMSADGRRFVEQAPTASLEVTAAPTTFVEVTAAQIAAARAGSTLAAPRRRQAPRRTQPMDRFEGKKKGLIILAEFQDKKFLEGHDRAYYERVANERGFSDDGYRGSVKDYFLDQSKGLFELDFDVVGPVTVSHDYAYYGQPGTKDVDAHPWEMVVEACQQVADQGVNFAQYDWNGDGFCEQVFVLYAGQGQSDSYDANTIWPHEYELHQVTDDYGKPLYGYDTFIGGCKIDTYACSNELTSSDGPSGIGTFCHEFSHCMGLPDLYDVDYNGYYGMGLWDLMANGVYNGSAFVPAAYTSYERMVCGWLDPIELRDDCEVTGMKALTDGGNAYIIYNEAHPDEYYLLENRQLTGWDAALPATGMLVLHVDYDERVWRENVVNSVCDYRKTPGMEDVWNTHQRLTIVPADNENDKRYWNSRAGAYTQTTITGDPYPCATNGNDSLTSNSLPAATVFNGNVDGGLFLNRGIQAIRQHDDGTISFRFEARSEKYVYVDTTQTGKPDLTGAIFYESFDRCIGTGGNDGVFKGSSSVASADFVPDNGGWDSMVMGGGARCAKFGNAANDGIVTSPAIMLTGDSLELCFKAAPWSRDDGSLLLSLSNGKLEQTDFEMTEGQWTTFTTIITGEGPTQITFTPGRRFFLDEVVVRKPASTEGIQLPTLHPDGSDLQSATAAPFSLYDLQGRRLTTPRHGLNIVRQQGRVRKLILP